MITLFVSEEPSSIYGDDGNAEFLMSETRYLESGRGKRVAYRERRPLARLNQISIIVQAEIDEITEVEQRHDNSYGHLAYGNEITDPESRRKIEEALKKLPEYKGVPSNGIDIEFWPYANNAEQRHFAEARQKI